MQPLNMIQRKDPNPFKTKLILESSKKKQKQTPPNARSWKPWCLKWGYVFLHFAFCHSPVKLGIFPTYSQRIPWIYFHLFFWKNKSMEFRNPMAAWTIWKKHLKGTIFDGKKSRDSSNLWKLLEPEPGGCWFSMVIVGLPVENGSSRVSRCLWELIPGTLNNNLSMDVWWTTYFFM